MNQGVDKYKLLLEKHQLDEEQLKQINTFLEKTKNSPSSITIKELIKMEDIHNYILYGPPIQHEIKDENSGNDIKPKAWEEILYKNEDRKGRILEKYKYGKDLDDKKE